MKCRSCGAEGDELSDCPACGAMMIPPLAIRVPEVEEGMSESQDRPTWRVSDERVRILCEEEEKLHSPWLTDSPLIRDEVELALDLRDARARIEKLEEQLALGARMEAHLAEKLDHADTALLKAMDRIKELEAALDASIALRKEAEEQFAVAAEANVRTEARIKELEAKLSRQAPVIEAARKMEKAIDEEREFRCPCDVCQAICRLDGEEK